MSQKHSSVHTTIPLSSPTCCHQRRTKCCTLDPVLRMASQTTQRCRPTRTVICSLCNSSLQNGIMPATHKHAIVLPRLKKSTVDPNTLSSYRPISNLSCLSKLHCVSINVPPLQLAIIFTYTVRLRQFLTQKLPRK